MVLGIYSLFSRALEGQRIWFLEFTTIFFRKRKIEIHTNKKNKVNEVLAGSAYIVLEIYSPFSQEKNRNP